MPQSTNKFEIDFLTDYTDEAILAEIRRVACLAPANQPLTVSGFNQLSPKVAHSTIRRRFGGWKEALERAGIAERYAGPKITERMRSQSPSQDRYSDLDLIAELQRVHKLVGTDWLSSTDFNLHSVTSHAVVGSHFGGFLKGLDAAGIPRRPIGKLRVFSNEQCFENIADLWSHYGRAPQYREMFISPSKILGKTYTERWGTWRRTLVAFVEWANTDDAIAEPEIARHGPEDGPATTAILQMSRTATRTEADCREIRPGLRFKVFRRDSFRCVACGRSPANHLHVELHADHILAVANGGKTTFENLQTLCQDCNLGKGKS